MNCKNAELYMNELLEKEPLEKESFEFIDHISSCKICKSKWEPDDEINIKLKGFVNSIKASEDLRKRISRVTEDKGKIIYLKPLLLAASITFLLGIGLILNPFLTKVPSLSSLHTATKIQVTTDDIKLISNKLKINLEEAKIASIEEADFKVEGASKIDRLFNNDINLVSFKNTTGQRLSVCYLPANYNVPNCHKIEVGGTIFHCGQSGDCEFAYWKEKDKTIAFVSDSLTSEEMISIALTS